MSKSKRPLTQKTPPLFQVGQIVDHVLNDAGPATESAVVAKREWAGHCWYYEIVTLHGLTWSLESSLRKPAAPVAGF